MGLTLESQIYKRGPFYYPEAGSLSWFAYPRATTPLIASSFKIPHGFTRGRRQGNTSRTSRSCAEFLPKHPSSQSVFARFVLSAPLELARTRHPLACSMGAV